jgi:hypothetical protein
MKCATKLDIFALYDSHLILEDMYILSLLLYRTKVIRFTKSFFHYPVMLKERLTPYKEISIATINYLHKSGLLFRIKTYLAFKLGHVSEVSLQILIKFMSVVCIIKVTSYNWSRAFITRTYFKFSSRPHFARQPSSVAQPEKHLLLNFKLFVLKCQKVNCKT